MIGAGGAIEKDYVLPVSSATVTVQGTEHQVAFQDNKLLALDIPAGETAQVSLVVPSGHRYRLEVR